MGHCFDENSTRNSAFNTFGCIDVIEIERVVLLVVKIWVFGLISVTICT